MKRMKKVLSLILILIIMFYSILSMLANNQVQARERTEDISNLTKYPYIYTAIQELKTAHPNWTFTILYTGLDWNTVIKNETTELHTRSLVHNSLVTENVSEWVCSVCGTAPKDNGSWYCASNKTVSYYMDTRNWLNETYIFAFETLSFNENVHTVEGVQTILSGTFMDVSSITYLDTEGKPQTINKSYAQIIYEAGKKNNVSPYHLAARIRQEQGDGTSSLISGQYTYTYTDTETKEEKQTVYLGYYNYFNVAASGSNTKEIIKNGLNEAKARSWTTPEFAINGGAEFLKGGYIGNYQDTLYLQKYHVDSNSKYSLYGHQYQQNVSAPYTESLDVYDAYEELGILESNFNFIIPVYENMPEVISEKPDKTITYTTEEVIVQTQTTDLSIRSGPSTGYYVKAKVPKGTIITRLEKANKISSDERYWDKVVYNNGTSLVFGYASREYLGDAEFTEKVHEEKTIATMCNLRNGPSTTNSIVKQILQPGTNVTIVEKLPYKISGHIWYRVKLADGTQGYISSAYLQIEPTEKYKVEGTYIKVSPSTKITDIPEAVLSGDTFGTGAKVTIAGVEYTVAMAGDANGDALIDSADLLKIVKHLKGMSLIEIEKAGDANNDGCIDSADLLKIVKHLKGISSITL